MTERASGVRYPCRYVYADGRKCQDEAGHEEYALNCGHLPPKEDVPPQKSPRPFSGFQRRVGALASVTAMAMLTMGLDESTKPRRELPSPTPLPPHPFDEKNRHNPHGRSERAPLSRAFHYEEADANPIEKLLEQSQKRANDQRHLAAAEAKRLRKAMARKRGK